MKVQKGNPEEAAVLDNIASLVEQLRAMGANDGMSGDGTLPGYGQGDVTQGMGMGGEPPVPSAEPQGEDDNQAAPEGPAARRPAMQSGKVPPKGMIRKSEPNQQADEMEGNLLNTKGEGYDADGKQADGVAKSIVETDSEGTQSLDSANDILFNDLPASTQENVKEIKKALNRLGLDVAPMRRRPVAKSMGAGDDRLARVEKSIEFLAGTVQEMLEGLQVAKSAGVGDLGVDPYAEPRTVQKSQDRRPQASYSNEDLASALRELLGVQKSQDQDGFTDDPFERGRQVHKGMAGVTEGLGQLARGIWQ